MWKAILIAKNCNKVRSKKVSKQYMKFYGSEPRIEGRLLKEKVRVNKYYILYTKEGQGKRIFL